jgi:hypothetical protein
MKTFVTIVGLVAMIAGCGTETDDPGAATASQISELASGPPVVGVGQHCGGNIQNAPVCGPGLKCVGGPLIGDVGGTCAFAQYGESCGGFVVNPVACDHGLVCSHVDAQGNLINPDLPGVCLEGRGQHCGGFIVPSRVCAPPLHCRLQSIPDVGGTCVR